ncbi:ABC transporter permease [Rubellicoccus peritrichatus]|uniref:FtsX-like permease family protein n=1 Tax=Rubellicoccus peritrichatus TaxID=3080537 RepID=A0AAQ3LBF6_9BACT|nr:FtsX-like permease family protein [Puniceicoccus sp. CR14]WOO42770.1 FtsX-like permease family protein [Puniceicoccus sp. CR14]
MSFAIKTAWRDARRHRKRLFLCALSIVFGVAALVAIDSFSHNLRVAIDKESMNLLGADLQVSTRTEFSEDAEAWFDELGGEQAREIRFTSMAMFPKNGQTRLVQVRALNGGFPFYGEFETKPANANPAMLDEPVIVMDQLLMAQYELEEGDTVELGDTTFTITGEIVQVPGEAAFAGIFAPRVYIPLSQLEGTGLIGFGSIAFHRVYIKNPDIDTEAVRKDQKERFAEERLNIDTIQERKDDIGEPLDNLARYLGLVGFVALLLGGVGIAGSVQAYLQQKRDTVAILRCLGSSSRTAFSVFLTQICGVALVGAILGAILGIIVQAVIPRVLAPLLPFDLDYFLSWPSILSGILYGTVTALIFGLFPLLPIRNISPLRTLRAGFSQNHTKRDPFIILLAILTAFLLTAFCAAQTSVWWQGIIFAAGLGVAVGILWVVAAILKLCLRKFITPRNYLLRQSLANLHRPNNRTVFLVVSLGMGTFLIYALTLIQDGLLQQTDLAAANEEPNLLFFDIQPDQKEGLYEIIHGEGLEIAEDAPMVTMRLKKVAGRKVADIKNDPENTIDEWILNREWRNTYRAAVGPSEEVVEGEYISEWDGLDEPVPVSIEDGIAADLGVGLGDTLDFDIQGIPMQVKISSMRKVDWTKMQPNFFITFPVGVLEEAPTLWIGVARSPDIETTATLQRKIFEAYPNISAIDLSIVLEAIQSVLGRINFAIRFMALFTVATGIVVLAGAVITSRYQRIRESVLLRTLGASGPQVRRIMAIEYAVLGTLAGIVGVGLAIVAGTALSIWVFKLDFTIPWGQSIIAVVIVTLLTLFTGLANSRGIASHPPLVILREEG